MNNESQIVLYQPDDSIRLEVKIDADNETVWLTQQQIAELFGTKRPAITKHLNNIYQSGELDKASTCSILEHMSPVGKVLPIGNTFLFLFGLRVGKFRD